MRLTRFEVDAIVETVAEYSNKNKAELRLYGSRVDDNARGGDIDLLLIILSDSEKQQLLKHKYEILVKIKEKIGEQKIDLNIATKIEINNEPFLRIILPKSQLLHKWQ